MGVKKQMDTFFASLGEQTGYRGRLVNTPMGPFRWNDVIELWENVNNGMVLNNISFMDEFAMMDYNTIGGGENTLNIVPVVINFTSAIFDSRVSFTASSPGSIINSNGFLDYAPNNIMLFSAWPQSGGTYGYGISSQVSHTLIDDVDGIPQNAARIAITQSGSNAINTDRSTTFPHRGTKTLSFWIRGNTANDNPAYPANARNKISVGWRSSSIDGPFAPINNGVNSIFGWSLNGYASIDGFTSGITLERRPGDPSRRNVWDVNGLSPTFWTKVSITSHDNPLALFAIYPGSLDNVGACGNTYTFDYCQFNMSFGSFSGYIPTRNETGGFSFYPRITSGPTGGPALGLWLEPAVTNLHRNSANLGTAGFTVGAGWIQSRAGVTMTLETLSPQGVSNAYKLFDNDGFTAGTIQTHRIISASINQVSGISYYTASAWFKANPNAGGLTNAYIVIADSSEGKFARAIFDLQNFTIGSTLTSAAGISLINDSIGIERYDNGWARCFMSANWWGNPGAGSVLLVSHYGPAISKTENSYQGTLGAGNTNFVYIYGPQLETGLFPSAYIPTADTASITKNAESASINSIDLKGNNNSYTLYSSWYTKNIKLGSTGGFTSAPVTLFNTATPATFIARNELFLSPDSSNLLVHRTAAGISLASGTMTVPTITLATPTYGFYTKQGQSFVVENNVSSHYMAVNGATGANSGTTAAGSTIGIPTKISFTNTNLVGASFLPGIILQGITYIPTSTTQEVLRQNTT